MKKIFLYCTTLCLTLATALPVIAENSELTKSYTNYHRYFEEGQKVTDSAKEEAINALRQEYAKEGHRRNKALGKTSLLQKNQSLMNDDGVFTDMIELESYHREQGWKQLSYSGPKKDLGLFVTEAFRRLWSIAEGYKQGKITIEDALSDKYLRSIIHYGEIELSRSTQGPRFHASCFFLPNATINIYFSFLEQMDNVEANKESRELLIKSCDILKSIALQSWTLPLRNDDTDLNVVQIDRFRHHVWWVGGNALGYRALLPTAVMYKSIPMIDLLAEVGQRSISTVSQNTHESAFWNEGITTDGAGWGHGKQALVWGYPIHGTSGALSLLRQFDKTPWQAQLTKENTDALMSFFRGSSWYYYNGYVLPCLDRYSAAYTPNSSVVPYTRMLKTVIDNWSSSLSKEEFNELKMLYKECLTERISMEDTPQGVYHGSRWFFNNDDLIKKGKNYHVTINMASSRCNGLESTINLADEYNFCTADGQTLFQRRGNEYREIIGACDVLALPGVTARQGMENLTPVFDWKGYSSKHNFAGAATRSGENSVAGFIFEKNNKKGDGDKTNEILYGVKAYKSYFLIGDYFIALGAGVTNLQPELPGEIRTTIDQTVKANKLNVYSKEGLLPMQEGERSFFHNGTPVWVQQDGGFAYTVLPEFTKNASFIYEQKPNEWVKRNASNKKEKDLPETADILRLWIDHGKEPVGDKYGYVVYCGENLDYKQDLQFEVLRNDTLIQAIEHCNQEIVEAVFYKAGSLKTSSITLKVSDPVIVLLEQENNEYILTINDPCMDASLKGITIWIDNKPTFIALPQRDYAGRPVTIRVKRS